MRSLVRSAAPFLLCVVLAAAGCAPSEEPPPKPGTPGAAAAGLDTAAHAREVEAWRAERETGLRNPEGWFSLVGLFWLKEGENRIGSDPGNTVILPEGKAPAVAGTLVRRGGAVRLEAAPGVPLQIGGRQVTAADLVSDDKGKPTEVRLGSLGFFLIQRGERLGVRVRDSASPALASFHGLDHYPVDPEWRVTARFEPYQPPKAVMVPNILGDAEEQPSPGTVVFERDGATHRLDALEGGEDGSLFLIFADATNQTETYGAGRFLDTAPPKDGQVVVDFNQSYNPPCAFTAFATCPLPPQQNRLALDVRAGEKKYGTGHP